MWLLRQSRLKRRQFRRHLRPAPENRRITLHIGAHKTGTTYIQRTLDINRLRLPLTFETVTRRDTDLYKLTDMAAGIRTPEAATAAQEALFEAARSLSRRFCRVRSLIITHEGLPGPLPGRPMFKGLYPLAGHILPPIVNGLRADGADVSVVFYTRRFRDWQASLYRYRFINQPGRGYNPARYAARTGLPENWDDLIARLRAGLGKTPLRIVSYEADRKSGFLGRALYQQAGMDDGLIARLKRPPPQNVSRPHTKTDRQFEA